MNTPLSLERLKTISVTCRYEYLERRIAILEAFRSDGTFEDLLRQMYEGRMSCNEIAEEILAVSGETLTPRSVERTLRGYGVGIRPIKEAFRMAMEKGRITWALKAVKKSDRKQVQPKTRMIVLQRDGFKCVLCGGRDVLEIDHLIARCKGGGNELANLRTLCHECNMGKRLVENEVHSGGSMRSGKDGTQD